jgi:hypothetical protein
MRVSNAGTHALADDYGDSVPVVGHVLTSLGSGLAPDWIVPPSGGVRPIAQTYVVDAVNFSATPTGTFGAPFQSCNQAIAAAVTAGLNFIQLLIAPSTYADAIAIPAGIDVTFHGWDEFAAPLLGGDITVTSGVAAPNITFTNCLITASNIRTANLATQDLNLAFINTTNTAAISANNLDLTYRQSTQTGGVTATAATNITFDGYSWAKTLAANPALPPGYTRSFFDAGHDVYPRALTKNGVAIGTTGFVTMAISTGAFVRGGEFAEVRVADPTVQDFICGVHGVGPGSVTCWITNLSRVSTNFNEAVAVIIHHQQMVPEPAP